MGLTYSFKTAKDILAKVERDALLLNEEVTGDHFYNFTITAYSLIDWVKNDSTLPGGVQSAVNQLHQNQWLKICGDIANASKHFVLTKRSPITQNVTSNSGFGSGRFGKGGFGIGEEWIEIELNDGSNFNVLDFTSNVLTEWRNFFVAHGI